MAKKKSSTQTEAFKGEVKRFTPRPYQAEAVKAAMKFFKSKAKKNSLIIVPTGGGKSLVVSELAYNLDKPMLVLQPNKEILVQNFNKLRGYGYTDCAIFSASLKKKEIAKITFATIGSIYNKMELFDEFYYVIVDEAHTCNAQTGMYKEFFDKCPRKILGLTATPYRLVSVKGIEVNGEFMPHGTFERSLYIEGYDNYINGASEANKCMLKFLTRTRPRIFTDVIYQISIQTLLAGSYLAKIRYFDLTQMNVKNLKRNSTGMDYDEESMRDEFARSGMVRYATGIINRLLHPKDGKPRRGILVFTRFVEEAMLIKINIPGSELVSGDTKPKERDKILSDFKEGKIKVLLNVGILTTGFDYPELDTIVMARPTMSLALYYQIVGRIIRPFEGKDSWFVDLGGNIKRFGKVEDLEFEDTDGYFISGVVQGERKQLTNVYY